MEPGQLEDLKAIGYLQGLESEAPADEEPTPKNNKALDDKSQGYETKDSKEREERDGQHP
jgi:hypothetical protein